MKPYNPLPHAALGLYGFCMCTVWSWQIFKYPHEIVVSTPKYPHEIVVNTPKWAHEIVVNTLK